MPNLLRVKPDAPFYTVIMMQPVVGCCNAYYYTTSGGCVIILQKATRDTEHRAAFFQLQIVSSSTACLYIRSALEQEVHQLAEFYGSTKHQSFERFCSAQLIKFIRFESFFCVFLNSQERDIVFTSSAFIILKLFVRPF